MNDKERVMKSMYDWKPSPEIDEIVKKIELQREIRLKGRPYTKLERQIESFFALVGMFGQLVMFIIYLGALAFFVLMLLSIQCSPVVLPDEGTIKEPAGHSHHQLHTDISAND